MTAPLSDLDLFRKLVSFDTTSSNSNLPLLDFVSEYVSGTATEVIPLQSADRQKSNLVVWFGPAASDQRAGLVLSGHTDTVPAQEPDWNSDPFTVHEHAGHYFARGAADMKGFLALALNAALNADHSALRQPLVLLFTYDEEVGTLGAQDFLSQWPRDRLLPRNVLIGEPTSLRVVSAHKGHLKLHLTIIGKSAHSAYPHLGQNAIERAAGVIGALSKLRMRLAADRPEHSDRFPQVPYATLNVGTIHGGTAVNIIPERCEIEVGIRLLPGMNSEAMIGEVREVLSRAVAPDECSIEIVSDSPPLLSSGTSIHAELCSMVQQTTLESVSFASDAGWFQQMDMDCILFGPGTIEVAHRANEFLPSSEFERAAKLLPEIIRRFCQ